MTDKATVKDLELWAKDEKNPLIEEGYLMAARTIKDLQDRQLTEHIATHHKGNNSAFARSQGVSEVQVRRWLKRDCMVIDGNVYCKVSKKGVSDE